jgi:hypothetical protein
MTQTPTQGDKAAPSQERPVIDMERPEEINGWPVISVYTTEMAESDGVLVRTGYVGLEPVYFTSNLMARGYEDAAKRTELVRRGLELLAKPDAEDTEHMRLRVLEKDESWVIHEPGKYTFLRPEDY